MTKQKNRNLVRGRITVAVGFDDQTPSLVESAVSFARKFDYQLRFVNVIEGPEFDPMAIDMPGFYSVPPVIRISEEHLKADRQDQMRRLLDMPRMQARPPIISCDCVIRSRSCMAYSSRLQRALRA